VGIKLGKKRITLLCVAAISFWLVMVALLINRLYFPDVYEISVSAAPAPESVLGDRWYGIYMRGGKIGYMVTATRPVGDGYLITEQSFMRLNTLGTVQDVKMRTSTYVDQAFGLRSFDFKLSSQSADFRVKGELKARKLYLNIITGGHETESTLLLKDTPYLWTNLRPFIAASGLEAGKKYRTFLFDPTTMANAEMIVEVVGAETLTLNGIESKAFKLRETFKGLVVNSWLDEEGETLKEESPIGLLMVREERSVATAVSAVAGLPPDILVSTSIPLDKKIERPRSVGYLKLKLQGLNFKGFQVEDQRQRLSGEVLEIKREMLSAVEDYPLPYAAKEFKNYLKPSLFIQSDDPAIKATAADIVAGSKGALGAVAKISTWVFQNLEKQYTFSIPSAVEVLKIRAGDCNEHTALFTALARSAGIPTRMATGLVYYRGSFYYHAWADVYLGRWVSVDPLLDQFPADATHMKLVEGGLDNQVRLVKAMGNLKIEVLEYR
jgi:hypothetical protein